MLKGDHKPNTKLFSGHLHDSKYEASYKGNKEGSNNSSPVLPPSQVAPELKAASASSKL